MLAIEFSEGRRQVLLAAAGQNSGAITVASALVVLTAVSTKLNVVIPGLAVPEFEGLRDAYVGPGLSFQYFPSTMEWLVGVWIVAVAGLLFLAAYRVAAKPPGKREYDNADKPALQG